MKWIAVAGVLLVAFLACAQSGAQQPITAEQQRAQQAYAACLMKGGNRPAGSGGPNPFAVCQTDPTYFHRLEAQREWNRQTAPTYDCDRYGGSTTCRPR